MGWHGKKLRESTRKLLVTVKPEDFAQAYPPHIGTDWVGPMFLLIPVRTIVEGPI